MKKYLVVICSLLLLAGCDENDSKDMEKSNKQARTPKTEVKSNSNSNVTSNIESNITSNVISNSNNTSNKKSNVVSNKTSQQTSNKTSQTTSNKTVSRAATGTSSKGYKIEKIDGIYYVKGILIANKTYDLPSNYNPGKLLPEFSTAFSNLKAAAAKDGVTLWVQSGFRSYQTQKTLYNRYVSRDGKKAADRYSARPGYSEHQTGLAADFNEISDTFGDTKAGKWLSNNCWKYGFILRYPKGKESETGYMYESWHFRYIGDVDMAKELYNNGNWISLESYLGIDSKYSD